VKRGGSLSFLVGTISNVLVMEIGWTDVVSGGYFLVSCAHSNTSFLFTFYDWQYIYIYTLCCFKELFRQNIQIPRQNKRICIILITHTSTVLIVPTKNERDPPLFTGKLLIKFQNILRNTIQVIIRHRVEILFSIISSPITLEQQKWKWSKMKGILLSSPVSDWINVKTFWETLLKLSDDIG
jgi:hypothetical protein